MHRIKGSWRSKSTILKIAAFATTAGLLAAPVAAVHSWNGYHWKRTSAQITPPVADNVTSAWDSYLRTANADWNRSTVIESPLVAGSANPRTCKPTAGTIQVCNAAYGYNGWLGIASIWLSDGHISQGTTKVNDTYYASATYNTPAWRAAVMCQEIGHDYGLGHQDEDFNTDATNSCMEYTNVPEGNEHPDQHDYDQLLAIYNHLEAASNLPSSQAALGNSPSEWGRVIDRDAHGRPHVFERDLGNGNRVITHITWTMETKRSHIEH